MAEWHDRFHYWVPPVPQLEIPHRPPRTPLKIAVLAGDRLFSGLRPEAELLLLTPDNFTGVLTREGPDLLLVESCQQSVTGHWPFAQTVKGRLSNVLREMLHLARQLNIPSGYWLTLDHIYIRHFQNIFSGFDHLFCADPLATEILRKRGYPATTLLPAIQPVIHHPFRSFQEKPSLEITTLYDGWADLLHFGSLLPLDRLDIFDVRIIDSRNQICNASLAKYPEYRKLILGSVCKADRLTALRYSKTAISLDLSLATRTEQSWVTVETAACRVPMVHLGDLPGDDPRCNLCIVAQAISSLRTSLAQLIEEPLHREETAQTFWREAHVHHTFARRLASICEQLEVRFPSSPLPMASIITPTFRPENIDQVLATYKRQNYPAKELIIVYNGPAQHFSSVEKKVKASQLPDITIQYLPTDYFAGAALNIGAHLASGAYCFRMDDDDYYSADYIADMMLHLNAVDADIFGKPPAHLFFEQEQELYLRPTNLVLTQLPNQKLQSGEIWLGGNTISGKTEILRQYRYPDSVFGTTDSAFQIQAAGKPLRFFAFDQNNALAVRGDIEHHTWRRGNKQLKEQSIHQPGGLLAFGLNDDRSYSIRPLAPLSQNITAKNKKRTILYLGPQGFSNGVWQNRARYIFPDLLATVSHEFSIHMLTGPVPGFAEPGIRELESNYGIIFHQLPRRMGTDPYQFWMHGSRRCAEEIGADLLTNIFGGVLFGYALTYIAKFLGISSIVRVAGDEIAARLALLEKSYVNYTFESPMYKLDRRKEILAFTRADRTIVMSPWERDRVIGRGAKAANVRIVIRGVDLNRFKPAERLANKAVSTFLYVGRNSLEKGYDIIENAAKILEKKHPELEFLFAGNFTPGKRGNRRYLGFVKTEDLPALYQGADALILSSRTEGMPQVVLEAMASGIPCILSRHLFESMFTDGVEALLTELEPEHLARQILRVHNDPDLAARLGIAGRKYAEEHFDKVRLQHRYRDIFLELLEEKA